MHIISGMTRDRHTSLLRRVFVLPMTAPRLDAPPAVILHPLDEIPNFHGRTAGCPRFSARTHNKLSSTQPSQFRFIYLFTICRSTYCKIPPCW